MKDNSGEPPSLGDLDYDKVKPEKLEAMLWDLVPYMRYRASRPEEQKLREAAEKEAKLRSGKK